MDLKISAQLAPCKSADATHGVQDLSSPSSASTDVLVIGLMEEWGYIEDVDLQNWKGDHICITCQHFGYGVDQHCRTLLACNLRRGLLQQGDHLLKTCQYWSYPSEKQSTGDVTYRVTY